MLYFLTSVAQAEFVSQIIQQGDICIVVESIIFKWNTFHKLSVLSKYIFKCALHDLCSG